MATTTSTSNDTIAMLKVDLPYTPKGRQALSDDPILLEDTADDATRPPFYLGFLGETYPEKRDV
ncbi:MAG: hypothetical protein QOI57_2077 [Rubrobacteraceae bacterium]|jgi:hypothetical protein|nr:hypothetical protein [Rubrobacteraceae bacterium]